MRLFTILAFLLGLACVQCTPVPPTPDQLKQIRINNYKAVLAKAPKGVRDLIIGNSYAIRETIKTVEFPFLHLRLIVGTVTAEEKGKFHGFEASMYEGRGVMEQGGNNQHGIELHAKLREWRLEKVLRTVWMGEVDKKWTPEKIQKAGKSSKDVERMAVGYVVANHMDFTFRIGHEKLPEYDLETGEGLIDYNLWSNNCIQFTNFLWGKIKKASAPPAPNAANSGVSPEQLKAVTKPNGPMNKLVPPPKGQTSVDKSTGTGEVAGKPKPNPRLGKREI
jgi:hypothetical protein